MENIREGFFCLKGYLATESWAWDAALLLLREPGLRHVDAKNTKCVCVLFSQFFRVQSDSMFVLTGLQSKLKITSDGCETFSCCCYNSIEPSVSNNRFLLADSQVYLKKKKKSLSEMKANCSIYLLPSVSFLIVLIAPSQKVLWIYQAP